MTLTTKRLGRLDGEVAREMFALMAAVFDETSERLSHAYVQQLLTTSSFWAVAAFEGERVVGGITAHTIPMTRSHSSELFIYDLAVHAEYRRLGAGRLLVSSLCAQALEAGISEIFVPADDDDLDALAFYRSLGGEESAVTFFTWASTGS